MQDLFTCPLQLTPDNLYQAITSRLEIYSQYGLIEGNSFRGAGGSEYRCPSVEDLVVFVLAHKPSYNTEAGFDDLELSLDVSGVVLLSALERAISDHARSLESADNKRLFVGDQYINDNWFKEEIAAPAYRVGREWVSCQDFFMHQPIPGIHMAFVRSSDDTLPSERRGGCERDERELPFTMNLALVRILHMIVERNVVPYVANTHIALCARNQITIGGGKERQPRIYWSLEARRLMLVLQMAFSSDGYEPPVAIDLVKKAL